MSSSMSTISGKRFGLIQRAKKTEMALVKKPSIFEDDSDEEKAHEAVNQSLIQEARKSKVKKQTQLEIQKALEEDPTVYEYDSIFDQMEKKKQENVVKKKSDISKKPKYIDGLMKAAKMRNKERERMMERKIQKEREEEGNVTETDAFVTSAYKKKLEEMKEEEEKEKREAEMEAMLDVTKQKDLSGFYRYLYLETANTGDAANEKPAELSTSVEDIERLSDSKHKRNSGKNEQKEEMEHRKRKSEQRNYSEISCKDNESKNRQRNEHLHDGECKTNRNNLKHRQKSIEERDYHKQNCKIQPAPNKLQESSSSVKLLEEKVKQDPVLPNVKYSKRNLGDSIMSAKERYLARQMTRVVSNKTAPVDEND